MEDLHKEFCNHFMDDTYALSDRLSTVSDRLKPAIEFIKSIAQVTKSGIKYWIELFKDSKVFKFFESFGFSIKKLFDEFFKVYSTIVKDLIKMISDYAKRFKIVKWTNAELKKLDSYLKSNPKLKRVTGVALAILLVYLNLHVTYIGDFSFDFDMSDVADALLGNYSLADVLGGDKGIQLLTLFTLNLVGISFPWNTPIKLLGIVGNTLIRLNKKEHKRFSLKFDEKTRLYSVIRKI
jgi:hypothetical protein